MRYHIDTIPLWDALRQGSECPLCLLRRKTEHQLADRFLGASVMEPDTRIQVNAKGFCGEHHRMLFALQNRLGHALMLLSHLQETRKGLGSALSANNAAPGGRLLKKVFLKPMAQDAAAHPLAQAADGCVFCDRLEETMASYAYTLLHLWKTDRAFQEELLKSKGLCLPHTAQLMGMAPAHLGGHSLQALQNGLRGLLEDNLDRLERELDWFTRKFDYRNADKDWGTSRDALERTAQKLRGWCIGKDPGLDG